jgi:signal transduction histidine kinase
MCQVAGTTFGDFFGAIDIIKEYQGTIQVDNRADEGARFLIQLPLTSFLKR